MIVFSLFGAMPAAFATLMNVFVLEVVDSEGFNLVVEIAPELTGLESVP